MDFILFLVISFLGGWLGHCSRLPMGVFLGAMTGVGLWKIYFGSSFTAGESLTFSAQILLGIMIGLSFSRFNKKDVKKIISGLFVLSAAVFTIIFGLGWLLSTIFNLSSKTSIIAVAPGSIAEMATLANEMNLDPLIVVSMHVVRVVTVVFLLSAFVTYMHNKTSRTKTKELS